MIYARIDSGVVAEILETDGNIAEMFHPDFVWVECGATVKAGDLYVDGVFSSPPPVEIVPALVTSVPRRQGRLALIEIGKLQKVEADIVAIEDPVARLRAQVEYEGDTWEIGNPFLQSMWASMGGTPEGLKDLFARAATL